MRLHHLGYVTRTLALTARRFQAEGAVAQGGPIEGGPREGGPSEGGLSEGGLSEGGPIEDPVQRVVVQFFREPKSGEVWELVAPLGDVEDSPLRARLSRGGGLDHVCYELEPGDGTLESVLDGERERGAQVVCQPVMAAAFGRRIAFVFRRSGRLVEFLEVTA